MANRSNYSMWILVVVLAVCLQVVFVFADCKQSATGTAIEFSKAYFGLDTDMENYLCKDLAADAEQSVVADYIQAKTTDAHQRGFGTGMEKRFITHLETETLAQDDGAATIHLKGTNRTCIHPIFTYVARLFHIGESYTFEETLNLVKENGRWKVCGAPYGLSKHV